MVVVHGVLWVGWVAVPIFARPIQWIGSIRPLSITPLDKVPARIHLIRLFFNLNPFGKGIEDLLKSGLLDGVLYDIQFLLIILKVAKHVL